MHTQRLTLPAALPLALGLLAPLVAQAPSQHDGNQDPARFEASLREATAVYAEGDRVVAGGWDYHAEIGARSMRFTPALGEACATTQHLQLTPVSFGRAGATQAAAAAAPQIEGALVAQRRAPGVSERYRVTSEGLALSWRFDAPLAGSGDLVVRYAVATTMASAARPDGGASFTLDGVGGVSIGGVTGVDAGGQQVPGELRLDGGTLELRLPGSFVDQAAYPLVLDPLIGTQFLATTNATFDDSRPDVAYDLTNDIYLIAYRRVFSAQNQAIRAQRINADSGALIGSFIALETFVGWADNPTVANVNLRDTFVVAWESATDLFAPTDILCRSVSAASGAFSSEVTVSGTPGFDLDPDASGDPSVSGDDVLIAFSLGGGGVRVAHLTCPSTGAAPVLNSTLIASSTPGSGAPALSKSNPGDTPYALTWREPTATAPALRMVALDRTGGNINSPLTVAAGLAFPVPGAPRIRADVDGDGTDYMVVWEVAESGGTERDVYARSYTWTGSDFVAATPATPLADVDNIDEKEPVVAYCEPKFVVVFSQQFLTGVHNYDIFTRVLDLNCAACGPSSLLTGINGTGLRNVEQLPAICSKTSTGSPEALIVFTESDDAPPFTSSVIAQRYQTFAGTTSSTVLSSACGSAANITTDGPFAVGNLDFGVRVTGLPATSLPLLNFANPDSTFPVGICGSCVLANPIATFFIPAVGSSAVYKWPLDCSLYPFVGTQFDVQWTVLSPGLSFCANLQNLTWTERMRITLGL